MNDIKAVLPNLVPSQITDRREKELMKACREFESIFTYELLKSMRNTVDKCDLFYGGEGEEIYQSLLDQEYAKKMAGNGMNSLAENLFRQLSGKRFNESFAHVKGPDICTMKSARPEWPLEPSVSSKFGLRKDPFTGETRFHSGIDIAAREGTRIRASLPGRVIYSDYSKKYGNLVVVDHGDGFNTLYAHNSDNLVKPGDWVEKGASVAKVGTSGRSTGPHLHFEVRRNGEKIDPLDFLNI